MAHECDKPIPNTTARPPVDRDKLDRALSALRGAQNGGPLEMGEAAPDGSIYVADTLDGKYRVFTMPRDFRVQLKDKFNNDAAKAVAWLNNNRALGHADWQLLGSDNMPCRIVKLTPGGPAKR